MTDAEWRVSVKPLQMLNAVQATASARKLRLFGCACCRRIWLLLTDPRSQAAVEVSERFVEGAAKKDEVTAARALAPGLHSRRGQFLPREQRAVLCAAEAARLAARATDRRFVLAADIKQCAYYASAAEKFGQRYPYPSDVFQANALRCIIGDSLATPVALYSPWQTATTVAVASSIYADRAFDQLPILADALEDAGCTDAAMLEHCRLPGEHFRGCWVVDLVLGKT